VLTAFSAPANPHDALGFAVGLLQIALAAVAAREIVRYGRRFPWLIVLSVFFAVRGGYRIYVAFTDAESPNVTLATDVLSVLVLVLLIAGLESTVTTLRRSEDSATWSQREYERALADFRDLVRHRLANPLSVLRGSVETLAAREQELDPASRQELFGVLRSELDRLEATALDPAPAGPEELALAPEPRPGPPSVRRD
jgi:signal transduction histidine kinase